MKLPQGEVNACLFHSERKQKSEEDGIGQSWCGGEKGPEGPAPKRDPSTQTLGINGGLTSPTYTGTLELDHITVQWEKLRPARGREPPQVCRGQWGSGLLGQDSFLPEAPPEPLLRAACGVLLHSQ